MYSGILSVPPTTATFDSLLNWYLAFGIGAAIIVIAALAIFMIRYRYRGEKGPMPVHRVEGWKIVLVTVLISMTVLTTAEYETFASFSNIETPTDTLCVANTGSPCVKIHLLAFQWGWNFTYPNGKFVLTTLNQPLTIPVGKMVILNISSRDVFHSFGIEMCSIKEDAIPGKMNVVWFEATQTGFYPLAIRCFELCGVGHAFMFGNLSVIDYAAWQTQFGQQVTY